ncbi:unnamed protein product [Linum tenue]|uniref:Uncharacterized protein n=1 Tax=Linum tenue TaxID=586396 RepID=A0AAV0H4H4_9ROSI|nr:unnamed protein product [Linum tenue]
MEPPRVARNRLRRRPLLPPQSRHPLSPYPHLAPALARLLHGLRPRRPRLGTLPLGHRQLRRQNDPRFGGPARGRPGPPQVALDHHPARVRQQRARPGSRRGLVGATVGGDV